MADTHTRSNAAGHAFVSHTSTLERSHSVLTGERHSAAFFLLLPENTVSVCMSNIFWQMSRSCLPAGILLMCGYLHCDT
jgi:hypothetical protein